MLKAGSMHRIATSTRKGEFHWCFISMALFHHTLPLLFHSSIAWFIPLKSSISKQVALRIQANKYFNEMYFILVMKTNLKTKIPSHSLLMKISLFLINQYWKLAPKKYYCACDGFNHSATRDVNEDTQILVQYFTAKTN